LVRLGQEVQALPRRVTAPAAPLAGASISLEPITPDAADVLERFARDDEIRRFTRVPTTPRHGFGAQWADRYVHGWADGSRAGFLIRDGAGVVVGLAAFVTLDREAREAELGYLVAPEARGRGIATEAVRVLTDWGFAELGLERIVLLIDVANAVSEKVAERCGYVREGTLRSAHVKEGRRADTGIWSRLRTD
jgi:RimJ/RimL family protein N-acetyltransferase